MKKWKLFVFLIFITGLFTSCGTKKGQEQALQESKQTADITTEVPTKEPEQQPLFGTFTTIDIEKNEVTSDIFEEYELTMVNVWGTFCSPCIDEMPDLGKIHEAYQNKGFQIVGIVSDVLNDNLEPDDKMLETAKEIVDVTNASYLHIVPSIEMLYNTLQYVSGVPTTFFVDKEGKQVGKTYVGARSESQWIKIIDELLKEISTIS